jgi:methyltransferase-like protein
MEHLEQIDIDLQAKQHDYQTAQPNVIEKTTQGINAIVEAVEAGVVNPLGAVEFTKKQGASKLNYSEDVFYTKLVEKVKAREELLKVAQKSTIYDDEGVEVPKVSISYNKDSLVVKFTN